MGRPTLHPHRAAGGAILLRVDKARKGLSKRTNRSEAGNCTPKGGRQEGARSEHEPPHITGTSCERKMEEWGELC
jgi:hypothetical protein